MKQQILFSFSLFLLTFSSFYYPINTASTAPASSPKLAPAPKSPSPASSKPLVPTLPDTSDSTTPDDITKILKKAKTFAILTRLLKTTEIVDNLNSQLITAKSGGLTIFAPDDSAFSNLKPGFLNSLNENKKIELLQFHILPQFVDSNNFDSLSNPVETVAGKDPLKLPFNVESLGNSVNISTGVVNATVTGVVYQDNKLAIYRLDKVLLPLDFFPSKVHASAPVAAKAPKADDHKDKSSSAEDNEDGETTQGQKKSGAVSFITIEGTRTMLVSLGVAFVAVAMI
ncbi:fasciclin-like arabinogalactan protein 11 [Cicer arietinum]|uniref:Fasciclin-like arabinogalactan protein 12 n=1 Tax=Cicer arietinum TaxID=3827 RepID=A0A1S2XFD2_CICAR|nr:fasciclin-like arabinogalactan protein 12 [Cicer arietinum]